MSFLTFALRSKRQTASAISSETIPPPIIPAKSSALSILRRKKPRNEIRHPAMTVKQLDDVMCRHPLSDYSRYPSESFPMKGKRGRRPVFSGSVSSESSSLLSSSSRSSSASRLSVPSPLSSAPSSFVSHNKRSSSASLFLIPAQRRQHRISFR
ncbi:hypothetical protein IW261DRAFT_1479874 [Armillaria novae-zelandiae]|uniref:Uncharacterized protein n=1 Tax=Armillaria novae-zelandiae TaxID=153914 RepID=A0AA39U7K5_9AGAR|nr:hypothetical protein IW261DRAFT_1479874 [Armillaria novae-zelandiae]